MPSARLLARQVAYENKAFWRNPAAAFFTVTLPIVLLVVLTSVFDDTATLPGGIEADISTYYVPAALAFAVFSTCYTNVAMSVTMSRDAGTLKRVRGTPLPVAVYLLGKLVHSVAVMLGLVVVTVAFGWGVYDVSVPLGTALPFGVTVALGAATFCALGLAVTSAIPNAAAAPAVMNAVALPVMFISGVFVPTDDGPLWMRRLADVFPVRHFIDSLFAGYGLDPRHAGGWHVTGLLVIAAWGAAGVVIVARWFRWTSRR
jgi:ABC-2 type transport system permease protein